MFRRQHFEQSMAISEKAAVFARRELIARPRQLNLDACDYCRRRLAEHDDAVAEIDRFFEIMGDEDDGYPLFAAS